FPGIYLPRDIAPTLAVRSRGAHLLVAGHGAVAGYSAAELLGARIAPRDADAEVVVPGGEFRECRGLRVHREQLAADEVETVAGLVVTSAIRTAYDLARWSTRSRASWRPTHWAGSDASDRPRCSGWPLATPVRGGAAGFRWLQN
ncbi:MAG: hypothetical protein ACRDTD_01275, partial [Pseudonocardiaceae bacterium]